MKRIFLSILVSFVCANANALAQRDSVALSKNFLFEDGVYLTYESFQKNEPDFVWDSLKVSLFSNPQNFLTQVQYIKLKKKDSLNIMLDLNEVWGFSIGGIPYLRLPDDAVENKLKVFAGLQLRGKICYYEYENYVDKEIEMSAYNPLTGLPFRTKTIYRKELVTYKKIMDFQSGERADFSLENLSKWIIGDQNLLNTIKETGQENANKRLFKILLIYVDRNLVQISKPKKLND